MKVLLLNGSPRQNGNTAAALKEFASVLEAEGIEAEIVWLGNGTVRDCIGCGGCAGKGRCVFNDDIVNSLIEKAEAADGLVVGTPVYYAHPSGRVLSVLDRIFYAGGRALAHKPAFAIACARRAGTVASFDVLNKYFTISQMPIVASTYWNDVFGAVPGESAQDNEGMQVMRNGARNMAWLLKCIAAGKAAGIESPDAERNYHTNFIR